MTDAERIAEKHRVQIELDRHLAQLVARSPVTENISKWDVLREADYQTDTLQEWVAFLYDNANANSEVA